MPAGIQVFNEDGSLQFNSEGYSLARGLSSVSIGTVNGSQALPAGGSGTYHPMVIFAQAGRAVPSMTISGNTFSWDFGSIPVQYRAACTVLVVMF